MGIKKFNNVTVKDKSLLGKPALYLSVQGASYINVYTSRLLELKEGDTISVWNDTESREWLLVLNAPDGIVLREITNPKGSKYMAFNKVSLARLLIKAFTGQDDARSLSVPLGAETEAEGYRAFYLIVGAARVSPY